MISLSIMEGSVLLCLVLVSVASLETCLANPVLGHGSDLLPPDLGHKSRAGAAPRTDPRLPLPTPQELQAIKKVAEILVMLGQQVIPAIIGDQPSKCDPVCPMDSIYDAVDS